MPPKPDFAAKTSSFVLPELHLLLAAGVIADDPVDVAGQEVLPQALDVLARERRFTLPPMPEAVSKSATRCPMVTSAEVDVRKVCCMSMAALRAFAEVSGAG